MTEDEELAEALRRVTLLFENGKPASSLVRVHRIPPLDYLVAAAAQEAGVDVLHYDHHFDRLAEVLHFDSRWVAPPGSL